MIKWEHLWGRSQGRLTVCLWLLWRRLLVRFWSQPRWWNMGGGWRKTERMRQLGGEREMVIFFKPSIISLPLKWGCCKLELKMSIDVERLLRQTRSPWGTMVSRFTLKGPYWAEWLWMTQWSEPVLQAPHSVGAGGGVEYGISPIPSHLYYIC